MVLHSPGCGRVGRRRHSTSWDVPRTVESGAFLISGLFSVRCVMPARPGMSVSVCGPWRGSLGAGGRGRGALSWESHPVLSCRWVGAPGMPSCDLAPSAGAARSQKGVRRGLRGGGRREHRPPQASEVGAHGVVDTREAVGAQQRRELAAAAQRPHRACRRCRDARAEHRRGSGGTGRASCTTVTVWTVRATARCCPPVSTVRRATTSARRPRTTSPGARPAAPSPTAPTGSDGSRGSVRRTRSPISPTGYSRRSASPPRHRHHRSRPSRG
ncbi:hypothetical protein BG618_03578 [Pseudonocardia autotrophica]|nr:hypothetical protein BG618_03578 [Pseudonocardia autotrophica]